MKRVCILICATSLIGMVLRCAADDKIEETFGVNLGSAFEPATALSTNSPSEIGEAPRQLEYEVAATKPIKPFDKLFVQITPKSHKVYRIIAKGDKVTNLEKKEVMADLQAKFPVAQRDTRRLRVSATTFTAEPGKKVTQVFYTAVDINNLAVKEIAEAKSSK